MTAYAFPPLDISNWEPTRDTLHYFARVLGRIRQHYAPEQKHWWMGTLYVTPAGLTTSSVPIAGSSIQVTINLHVHRLQIVHSGGMTASVRLAAQSHASFAASVVDALDKMGVSMRFAGERFEGESLLPYHKKSAETYRNALVQVDNVFKQFRAGFREESSPVHVFPHHFDLAVTWFSGRRVPGQDPDNPEYADEQMTFGFVTGDGSIAEPYFYATAYPTPEAYTKQVLPAQAYWFTDGWTGAVLPYDVLVSAENPDRRLLDFLHAAHRAGKKCLEA